MSSDTLLTQIRSLQLTKPSTINGLSEFYTGLKILGFVQTGVPVQVWPGAPTREITSVFQKSPLISQCLKKRQKEPIGVHSDTPVTHDESLILLTFQTSNINQLGESSGGKYGKKAHGYG